MLYMKFVESILNVLIARKTFVSFSSNFISIWDGKCSLNYHDHHFNMHVSHLWLVLNCRFWFHVSGVGSSSKTDSLAAGLLKAGHLVERVNTLFYIGIWIQQLNCQLIKVLPWVTWYFQTASNQFRTDFVIKWVMNYLFVIVEWTRVVYEQLLAKSK